MPMPIRLLITYCGVERWASRATSRTTAVEALTISESCNRDVAIHMTVKTAVGTAASITPRIPPNALASWDRIAASTVSCAACSVVVICSFTIFPLAGSGLIDASRPARGPELVTRVEHHLPAVLQADQPFGQHHPARFDPRDPPAPEPDQIDHVRAVVKLRLERGRAAPRP